MFVFRTDGQEFRSSAWPLSISVFVLTAGFPEELHETGYRQLIFVFLPFHRTRADSPHSANIHRLHMYMRLPAEV